MAAAARTYKRYALYVTPDGAPWARVAQAWLEAELSDLPALPQPLSEITAAPRRYGLHGTIVPPFFPASPDTGLPALRAAVKHFCAAHEPICTTGLRITQLGRFLALTPEKDSPALRLFASAALELCDPFRAPLSQADLQRHLAKGLSPVQEALLRRWGYPYVHDAFRFHITLTSRLPKRDLPAIRALLEARLAPLLPAQWSVDHLSLMGEDAEGRFHLIERFALGCQPA